MNKLFLIIIIVIIFSLRVSSAEISGKSYSPELKLLKNVIVEINTQPKQIAVTDPSYSFTVSPGNYIIKAKYENNEEYYLEENVTVSQDGKFSHDLILFYQLEDEDMDLPEVDDLNLTPKTSKTWLIIIFLIAIIIGFFSKNVFKKNIEVKEQEISQELKDDLKQVLEILKQNNGRINQKDLRKNLNLSEAKVSLMISELESLNKVKRIKKGRANVVVLN